MNKQQFIRDLCKTFGTGGLVCSFNDKELAQYLEQKFPFNNEQKVKKGAGRQPDDNLWVLSPTIHINSSGDVVPASNSKYAWQPIGGPVVQLIGKDSSASSMRLESEVQLDLESSSSLRELLEAIRAVFKHNFIAVCTTVYIYCGVDSVYPLCRCCLCCSRCVLSPL